jgi:peptidoglycan/xylan/chitin deacetylase (PgdA/CDA1 family)
MRNLMKKLDNMVSSIVEKSSYYINPLLLNFADEKNQLAIFYFHGIFESNEQKELNHIDPQNNITVKEFGMFIDYFLELDYIFIKPDDLANGLLKDRKYAMITFDDGYFNNILALEILNKFKVPAVIFVTTKNVEENNSFWWDVVFKFRKKQGVAFHKIKKEQQYLKKFKYQYIENYIVENFGSSSWDPWSDIDRPLNPRELKEFNSNDLISLGNHTHNHAVLIHYSEEEIWQEYNDSNKLFMSLTGEIPKIISFPNGAVNSQVLKITKDAGFQYAFSTIQKKNSIPLDEPFTCLNRLMTMNRNIKNYGSFYRIGYNPNAIYADLKRKIFK